MKKPLFKGFTLIELLIVIAIIGLLATVAMVAVGNARAKARDVKKLADTKTVSSALEIFNQQMNRMPQNYQPGFGVCEGSAAYDQSMQELVTAGVLRQVPKSPGGSPYCYYDYGSGNNRGAMFVTQLEVAPASDTGLSPSCRPFAAGTNWCDQSVNRYYCLCALY